MDRRQFAHRGLRARRIAAGMRIEQVALLVDRSAAQLHNIECGRSLPSVTTLLALSSVFGCQLDDLFTDQPEPAPIAA